MTKEQFLAFSLPFDLCVFESNKTPLRLTKANYNTLIDNEKRLPILYPLSDLKKEINYKGNSIIPIKNFARQDQKDIEISIVESSFIELLSFYIILQLIEWHFDIAGLIDKGEAVDINTLADFYY